MLQVCLAAVQPVALGHAQLQQWTEGLSVPAVGGDPPDSPQVHTLASSDAYGGAVTGLQVRIYQNFTEERGHGAAAVYARYGDGRVSGTSLWPQLRLSTTNETLLQVKEAISPGLFSIQVSLPSRYLRTACGRCESRWHVLQLNHRASETGKRSILRKLWSMPLHRFPALNLSCTAEQHEFDFQTPTCIAHAHCHFHTDADLPY